MVPPYNTYQWITWTIGYMEHAEAAALQYS